MLAIVLAMLTIVAIATVVVVYVAFPHRGLAIPHSPWLTDVLRRGVQRLPTLANQRPGSGV